MSRASRAAAVLVAWLVLGGAPAVAADAPPGEAGARIFDLRIEGRKVAREMRVIRVKQGDAVRLRWTSAEPGVLHFHGYNLERRVGPGAVAEMGFTAGATGRFPIYIHDEGEAPSRTGGGHRHDTPLLYVEVYPR
jgi:FtsP/CotA-like multicopper oxidase with cupredoxin domain